MHSKTFNTNKKKSAPQNWYKFKCQKVGNFCVDMCNCLRIIAKLKWASRQSKPAIMVQKLWRFEIRTKREREKNKNENSRWKINVNEINDNNIAYDGDKADVCFCPEICSFLHVCNGINTRFTHARKWHGMNSKTALIISLRAMVPNETIILLEQCCCWRVLDMNPNITLHANRA